MQVRRPTTARAAFVAAAFLAVATLIGAPGPVTAQTSTAAQSGSMQQALDSRAKGGDSARVTVFEIADFQCPYCARFAAQVAPELDERYVETGRVQWVFVNLPLQNHPLAWHAAEAALCAGAAGDQFWPMHDRLFAEQQAWAGSDDPYALFRQYAADLQVPAADYERCVRDDEVAPLILQDMGSAVSAGITGTPTFIVLRGQEVVDQVVGVKSVAEWSDILDAALQAP